MFGGLRWTNMERVRYVDNVCFVRLYVWKSSRGRWV